MVDKRDLIEANLDAQDLLMAAMEKMRRETTLISLILDLFWLFRRERAWWKLSRAALYLNKVTDREIKELREEAAARGNWDAMFDR